ncbi:uncharacterized protein LOC141768605 [Sebastes fasciatus]|uniref:uncharacterized protein LOC141768605 n=1 Tax=Sebastes fasciatus TaxID=394691 RepID=UPI003D9DE911
MNYLLISSLLGVSGAAAFVLQVATSKETLKVSVSVWPPGSNIYLDGPIILKTPASPVFEGDKVVLYCQYWSGNHSKTTFFKNGAEMVNSSSSTSDRVMKMTIENVTQEDEGFYKCASQDGKMESPESWLSVRPDPGNFTSADGTAASTNGSRTWIIVSCGIVLLLLIPLTIWLVRHYRCWPFSKEDLPEVELPATKQDVTEVQWDLSWMEMSNLLDKQLYPGP